MSMRIQEQLEITEIGTRRYPMIEKQMNYFLFSILIYDVNLIDIYTNSVFQDVMLSANESNSIYKVMIACFSVIIIFRLHEF